MNPDLKNLAKKFFIGVYEGNPSIVEELAADNILATYPIFVKIFNTTTLRGREAYRQHALNFSNTWKNAHVTIHDAIAEGQKVILIWSFRAQRVATGQLSGVSLPEEHRWGGITLLHFDKTGKIIVEVGEESEPGPQERLVAANDTT